MDHALLVEATELAWRWHGHQTRKGKTTPYMTHLLQVQGLVFDYGGDMPEAVAALLHDSLEDADDPEQRSERKLSIESHFGKDVLRIVLDCTDTTADEAGRGKGPWRERKQRYLEQLRKAGPSSLLVAACDKRHNLGDLVADLRHEGVETLARFNAKGPDQIWYYESVLRVCRSAIPERLSSEFERLLDEFRSFVEPAPPSPDAPG
ncbi:MAG: HD domain-containing protein [Proteobacteria bacterium]|nr:HD domain-containing protein [Pseudomonadota bacterium]